MKKFTVAIDATLPTTAIASLSGRKIGSLVALPKSFSLLAEQKITSVSQREEIVMATVEVANHHVPRVSGHEQRLVRRHLRVELIREFLGNMPGAPITLIAMLLSASFMVFGTFSTDISGLLMRLVAGVTLGGSLGVFFFMSIALREQIRAMRGAVTIVYPGGRE